MFPLGPIIFVGDSLTEQWCALRPDLFREPQVVGRGIGGQTTRQIALRLRSEIASTGARGLHLWGGINDVAGNEGPVEVARIVRNLADMLSLARDLHVVAWVASVAPTAAIPWNPGVRPGPAIAEINDWLRRHAAEFGARFIDYHAALADAAGGLRPEYGTDGVHLSPAGYAAIEPVMLAALTAPDVVQIFPPEATGEETGRRKFLHHFGHFSANTRYPSPYVQFTGKPGASHFGVPFDADGFRNASPLTVGKPPGETRVLFVGDSTVIDGGPIAETLPGRLERILRAEGMPGVRVHNCAVMSSCLTQMVQLVWSRLLDYRPDAIVVLGGGTDLFQPWTYDPRPGHPYNAFVLERLYDHFFDDHDPRAREDGLSYGALIDLIYGELERLRAEAGWRSEAWEIAIVAHFERAMRRLAKLSADHAVPILGVLQPSIVRKRRLTDAERGVASADFLAYLDRQYGRLEAVMGLLARTRPHRATFAAHDYGGAFHDREAGTFDDIVHYDGEGREIVARRLAGDLRAALREAEPGLLNRLRRRLR